MFKRILIVGALGIILGGCQNTNQLVADANQYCEYAKSSSFNRWQNCFFGTMQGHGYRFTPADMQMQAYAQYLGEQERLKRITTAEANAQFQYFLGSSAQQQQREAMMAQAAWGARMQAAGAALSAAGAPPPTVVIQQSPRTCYVNGRWINCY